MAVNQSICSVPDCEKPFKGRGLCNMHLKRLRRYGDVNALHPNANRKRACSVEGCDKPQKSRGWCEMHYQRWKTKGEVGAAEPERGRNVGLCSMEGCDSPMRSRGWCASHSAQFSATGKASPFKHKWADRGASCGVCSRPVPPGSGRRSHCSSRCQVLANRYGNKRPTEVECVRCGVSIDLLGKTRTGQFPRVDTKLCSTCRNSRSLRHKVSVRELANLWGAGCGICDAPVDLNLPYPNPLSPSVDHVIPYAKGGSHDLSNLRVAHLSCNHIKRDREGFTLIA